MQLQPPSIPSDDEIQRYVVAVMDDYAEFLRTRPAEIKEMSRRYLLVIHSTQMDEEKKMPLLTAFHDQIARLGFTLFSMGYMAGRTYVEIPEVFQEREKPSPKPLPWYRRLAARMERKRG